MDTLTAPAPRSTPLNPQEVLQKILAGLEIPATVDLHDRNGALLLHINTPDPGRVIGKQGHTLGQLQFLVNRILLRHDVNAPRVTVDCERYRERENDDLIKQAVEAADRVRRWGESVHIGPFSAFDRQIIHRHFDQNHELEAISEAGDEAGRKKMTIRIRQTPLTAPGQAKP